VQGGDVILCAVLTVISEYAVRRGRKDLHAHIMAALGDKPTLLAILADKYTNEDNLRPFVYVAERFGDRLHVIVAAEWRQDSRERDGETALLRLGVAPEARRRLLRDEGTARIALILRQKIPVALVELFFEERGYTALDGSPDPRGEEIRARENQVVERIENLLGRLPPPAPPPPRTLRPGEHDFNQRGICNFCGQGRSSLMACTGTKRDEGPQRDRFELIELD
jgi:hypothetical protein